MQSAPPVDYRSLVDHMLTAVMQVSPTLKIEYMNSACEALLDISRSRAIGLPLLSVLTEQDQSFDTKGALLRTLKTGQPYTRREAVLSVGLKDKSVDYTVSLIIDERAGAISNQHLLIEIQPIDRFLRINREEHLTQQHQIARQLVRGVAHEIKNPLGGIRGATQLLARSLPSGSVSEYTDIIIREVDRLRTLADSMLGSRHLPSLQMVNIHEPLERVRSLVLSQTKNTVRVVRDYDLSLPDVLADRDQLIQVILNICVNAVQAITENPQIFTDREPQIILRTRIQRMFTINSIRYRSVIRIDLEDNGPGIPPDIIESVFYPMVTGRASGTGLGLSIAQNIMHQHRGLIECESQPGCTVFSLFLPWE
jgi:two-component system nitrogen regulation sensor histidine kinase GlnL